MPKIKPKQEFWWEHGGEDEDDDAVNDQTIVIQPGSINLRIGRVSDEQPVTVLHCIARKIIRQARDKYADHEYGSINRSIDEDSLFHRDSLFRFITEDVENSETFKQGLAKIKALLPVPSTKLYMTVNADDADDVENAGIIESEETDGTTKEIADSYNTAKSPNGFSTDAAVSSADEAGKSCAEASLPDTLYDGDALQSDASLYHLFFPYLFGTFNLHDGVGGSRTSTLNNMLSIWEWTLLNKLRIPRAQRATMNVLLAIPNFYSMSDVYVLVELLVNELGFGSFQLYTEIGCVACATPVFTACIVDIGATQTTVACCDDGYVMPETLVTTKLGGNDVTSLCNWLLSTKIKNFHYGLNIPRYVLSHDLIKQQMCVLDWDLKQSLKLNIVFPGENRTASGEQPQHVQRLRISVPNNLCLTPGCVLFFPFMLTEALDDTNCPPPATRIRRNELPLVEHSSEVLPDEDIDQYYAMLDENIRRMLGFPTPTAAAAAIAAATATATASTSLDVEMADETAASGDAAAKLKPGPKPKAPMTASSLANLDEVMSAVIAAATVDAPAAEQEVGETAADADNSRDAEIDVADDAASDTMQIELADEDENELEDDEEATRSSGVGDLSHAGSQSGGGLVASDSTSALKSSASQPESSVGTPVPQTTSSLDYHCKTPVTDMLTPVDELVLWSINQIETKEVKGRCLKNIIIVGGGGYYLKGIEDVLRLRLEQALPKHITVTVMVNPPDAPGEVAAWQGAAVMASTPVCQNLWIKAEDWNKRKLSMLRENALFPMLI